MCYERQMSEAMSGVLRKANDQGIALCVAALASHTH